MQKETGNINVILQVLTIKCFNFHEKKVIIIIILVQENLLSYQRINLVFDGLDTFASVRINNEEVLISDNMFLQYVVDVTTKLKAGENTLEIIFKSAVEEATRLYEEQLKDYEVVPTCVPDDYHGECHVNHIRKMQASFSWDWGPALPSVGIW